MQHKYTNKLIDETSPYLLQHAHNPVDWQPWSPKAMVEAKKNNKLIIISIGYAACHWCHVMEHESFEDSLTADLMNTYYVPIKVDREEHPDVDKIYMSAVQQLTGRGGWPLNVVALPDGSPVWGGTYFPNSKWKQALQQIADIWKKNPEKLYKIADQLKQGIKQGELIAKNDDQIVFKKEVVQKSLSFWKQYKDDKFGGLKRAPKFPMPAQYQFLLRAGEQMNENAIKDFVKLTLDKMIQGGIYDHVNGGFARYATDTKWHIPHFEKMLYDNAQLVSLYSQAYTVHKNKDYEKVVSETLHFVEQELMDKTGVFYSSLDADSKNAKGEWEEGAYYVFTKDELKSTIGDDFPLFKEYFNINSYGLWEDGKYHLIKKQTDEAFVQQYNIDIDALGEKVKIWKKKLYNLRQKRERPRLDDKTLTSWNALMINAYVDAYKSFHKPEYLETAKRSTNFLLQAQMQANYALWHSYKQGKSSIDGYLEDYALLIKALINLYEASGEESYLKTAQSLTNYTIKNFYDKASGMFFFTDQHKNDLLTRPMETIDNVIPSSNAIMADNLFRLGHYFEDNSYIAKSNQMIHNMLPKFDSYAPGYYQWLNDYLDHLGDFYELAITGKDARDKANELFSYYIPNKIVAISSKMSDLPLLKERYVKNKTLIYLCVNNTCQLPETEIEKIVKKIETQLR